MSHLFAGVVGASMVLTAVQDPNWGWLVIASSGVVFLAKAVEDSQ